MSALDNLFFPKIYHNGAIVVDVPQAIEIKDAGGGSSVLVGTANGRTVIDFSSFSGGGGGGGGGDITTPFAWDAAVGDSPAATVDNWSPANLSTANTILANLAADSAITGLTGGSLFTSGRVIVLTNLSNTFSLTLQHDRTSSSAANRFYCPNNRDVRLNPRESVILRYDASVAKWRVIRPGPSANDYGSILNQTIAANQDNWNPFGLDSASTVVRITAAAPYQITGLAGGMVGRIVVLCNTSASTITLKHASASSTASNRFAFANSRDFNLLSGAMVTLWYDNISSRWRTLGAGSSPLSDVLTNGNTTSGQPIIISTGDSVQFDNGSRLQTSGSNLQIIYPSPISGAANSIEITAQDSSGGDGDGGNVYLTPGGGSGAGVDGKVSVIGEMTLNGNRIHNVADPAVAQDAATKASSEAAASAAASALLTSNAPAAVTKSAAAVGVATKAAREDHKHDVSTAAAVALSVGGSNAEGSATTLARSDHTHQLPAFGSTAGTFAQGNDSRLSDDRTAAAIRTANNTISVSAAVAPLDDQQLRVSAAGTAVWKDSETRGRVTAIPTSGYWKAGQEIKWAGLGKERRAIVATRTGALGQVARANSTAYSRGSLITQSSKIFVCRFAGTSAGSAPGGYATAVEGDFVTDNTAIFECVSTTVQDPAFESIPRISGSGTTIANSSATIVLSTTGSVVFAPAFTANSITTLSATDAMLGDIWTFIRRSTEAFTWTIRCPQSVGQNDFVIAAGAVGSAVFQFDGSFWQFWPGIIGTLS